MSLTDLKKNAGHKPNKKKFTIDEFISDAENYAKGTPEIVNAAKGGGKASSNELNLAQALSVAREHKEARKDKPANNKPFRHSTFTLSEEAIEQLQLIAKETKLAKSHIIRILIDELCNKDQHEQLAKLFGSSVP